MKFAIGTDMDMPVVQAVASELQLLGHEVEIFGAKGNESAPWPQVAVEVASKIAAGTFDQAVLFCWTGTGISIAANKVKGIRAALCHDAQTATGARQWNDANILCMSLRASSVPVAKEILEAWLAAKPSEDKEDTDCLVWLEQAEKERMK